MRNYTGDIIEYSDNNLSDKRRKRFEEKLMSNNKLRDYFNLFKRTQKHMQGKFDLEEVQNDPNLLNINLMTSQMIFEFHNNPSRYKNNQRFVTNALSNDNELQKQLDSVKHEAEAINLNKITGEWVNEWNAKKLIEDPRTESRRAFISSSLNDENLSITKRTNRSNSFAIRIAGLTAAAVISMLLVIKTLNPSSSPEKLYQEFYKPLTSYSSASRSNINTDPLLSAVELYEQGQYNAAAAAFAELPFDGSNITQLHFYAGITQLELGDFKKAIGLLSEVVNENGKYKSATQWYLGLAYLKAGEIQKAKLYLSKLTQLNGFYSEVAQDLLNRLE